MEQEIGAISGVVWRYLYKHGKTSITKLVADVSFEAKIEKSIVYMAIGWLAREGKLNFVFSADKRCDVSLK